MLIVRFAPGQAPLHWQLFAPGEPHHEASGRWPADDASPFPTLAAHYPAWVLIPASDCAFHTLTLPAGLRKPPLQVAPFLLEEQLADEVEATHFALLHRQQAQCEIVAVQRQKMRDWLARCESLSLRPGVDARCAGPAPATAGVERGAGGRPVADPPPAMGRHGGGKPPAGGAAAGRGGRARHRQLFASPRRREWRAQPAQTLLSLAASHPAAQKLSLLQGSSPSAVGGLIRRAGVRRGMPRWPRRCWRR